ncbi:hypothetical protein C4J81_03480 [Deltaproteobacteria bacterium Smac51]|nr:hypothetical protein C4J81_03480 [Deltaproteobacteria bacterium Smac51]
MVTEPFDLFKKVADIPALGQVTDIFKNPPDIMKAVSNAAGHGISSAGPMGGTGFSWAMGGNDVGSVGTTKVTSFAGFDYVVNPGFAANRGYILESAGAGRNIILESLSQAGFDGQLAEAYLNSWNACSNLRVTELESCLARQSAELSQMHERLRDANQKLKSLSGQLPVPADVGNQTEQARTILENLSLRCAIMLPDYVKEALLAPPDEDNIQIILDFMQKCTQINLGRLPIRLPGLSHDDQLDDQNRRRVQPVEIEYGTAEAGLAMAYSGTPFRPTT